MKKKNSTEKQLANIEEGLSKTEQFIEDNSKVLFSIIGFLVFIFIAFYGYKNLYEKPLTNKAQQELIKRTSQILDEVMNAKSKLDIDLSENNYGDGQFAVGTVSNGYLPTITALKHAYPNPFNPITNIKFDISKTDMISIDIYDIKGRKVENLISKRTFSEGQYEIKWNASKYSSGMYFVKLTTSNLIDSHKIILMK